MKDLNDLNKTIVIRQRWHNDHYKILEALLKENEGLTFDQIAEKYKRDIDEEK